MRLFEYCPRCGKKGSIRFNDKKKHACPSCGFTFFFNPAAAAAAIIEWNNQILITIRKHPPEKDSMDLPGGFIEPDETAEDGIIREIREELGITLHTPKYLFSLTNHYPYKGIEYNTLDLFFHFVLKSKPRILVNDDVSGFLWRNINSLNPDVFPFESIKEGVRRFKSQVNAPSLDESYGYSSS